MLGISFFRVFSSRSPINRYAAPTETAQIYAILLFLKISLVFNYCLPDFMIIEEFMPATFFIYNT